MSFYANHILPWCLNLAMQNQIFLPYRRRLLPGARGRVLEIGVGSGLNLPFYNEGATEIIGLEPSPKLVDMTRRANPGKPLTLHTGSAEAMPFDGASFDTVVTTWTLCTIPGVADALAEMRRVLRPDGQLLFAEHGLSPDAGVSRWQNRLTPAWKRIAGGCHMNRPIQQLIVNAGFRIDRLDSGYAKGPKPLAYMFEGSASKNTHAT